MKRKLELNAVIIDKKSGSPDCVLALEDFLVDYQGVLEQLAAQTRGWTK